MERKGKYIRLYKDVMYTTETVFCLRYKHGKLIKFLSGTPQSLPLAGTHANIERRADLNLCIDDFDSSLESHLPLPLPLPLLLCSVFSPAASLPASLQAESSPGFLAGFVLQRRLEAAVGRGSYFLPHSSSSHVLVLRLYLCSLRVSQVSCSFSSLVFVRLPTGDWQLW